MNARIGCVLALLSSIVVAWPARADIAPPALEDVTCPRGAVAALPEVPAGALDARGRPLRPWPYCAPSVCTSDADCTGGMTCSREEIGLCVESQDSQGAQLRSVRDRGCEPDGTCLNMQSTCERARRCVRDAAPPSDPAPSDPARSDPAPSDPTPTNTPAADPPAASSSSGCAVSPGTSSARWALALPLLALALRRRSRR